MDDPTPPDETAPPPETVPPREATPPRLWRGESAIVGREATDRRPLASVLVVSAMLVVALAALAFWSAPAPSPTFVPLWAAGAPGLAVPTIPQADRDFRSIIDPSRNPLARSGVSARPGSADGLTAGLAAIATDGATDTLVVYLCARACPDPREPREVRLLPPDAATADDLRAGGTPLGDLLKRLQASPARRKLLILDLHPTGADPRLGFPEGDLFGRLHEVLIRFPDERLLVLTSSGPGEVPGTSEALGRSAFGFYLEEGLRGWADSGGAGGEPDGRVTARELAAYVAGRVDRWSVRARGVRQSPTLIEGGVGLDFPLVALRRGRPSPPMVLPEEEAAPEYPAWLHDGWALRDGWLRIGAGRDAPALVARLEAALLAAEHDWRGGLDPEAVRARLAGATDRLKGRLGPARAIPRPGPTSLAQEEAAGRSPDPAVVAAVADLLAKRPEPKPGEGEAAESKAIAGFFAAAKIPSDFDLAAAVVGAAASDQKPGREALGFLDRLLRTRQARPLFAETDALHRLADLPARGWEPETVGLALAVALRGELAASRPGPFARLRPLLDAAEGARHEAESLLACRGYVPEGQAERRLREADSSLRDVLAAEGAVDRARRLADEALSLLPAILPVVDAEPDLDASWFAAAQAAHDLLRALDRPSPTDLVAVREGLADLGRLEGELARHLDGLRRPFAADRLARLTAPDEPGPEAYRAIEALLATAIPPAGQRADLWTSLRAIDRRLNIEVRGLDGLDGRTALAIPPGAAGSGEARGAGLARRSRQASALLALAEIEPPERPAPPTRGGVTARPRGRDEGAADDAPGRAALAAAWAALRSHPDAGTDPVLADRRVRLAPPGRRGAEVSEDDPTRRLRTAEAEALGRWLADDAAFRARDLDGSPFFASAARLLRRPGDPAPIVLLIQSGPTATALDPARPAAAVAMRFALDGPSPSASARVEVVTADAAWLEVRRGAPWPAAGGPVPPVEDGPPSFPMALDATAPAEVPLEVRLRPDPDPAPPVPPGFLLRARLGGRTYHHRIPLAITPASRRLRIALGPDPAHADASTAELRLRATPEPASFYLHVTNPTETERPLIVQLLDAGGPLTGGEAALKVEAGATRKVEFGAPSAKPEADAVALRGPLRVRLLDASDRDRVLAERTFPVGVAGAAELVRVVEARFDPRKADLSFRLRAASLPGGTPCAVALVLAPEEIPGLLAPGEGTLRAELAAVGDEATLNAERLRFDNREAEEGAVALTIDGITRAMVFRTTFARSGEPTTPRQDGRPRVGLRVPEAVLADAPLDVGIALDNPPPGGRLELTLGRYVDGEFRLERTNEAPATRESIRINPRGPGGALRLAARVDDPVLRLDVRKIRGRREVRVRLLDAEGRQVAGDAREVVFDDRPPANVRIEDLPKYALKGTSLNVRASGTAPGVGLARVVFFAGRPVEGKVPPDAVAVEAKPLDAGRTLWAAKLPVPEGKKGPTDITAQFVNGLGLSTFRSASVEVVDAVPVEPGGVRGSVVEGPRPQPGLEVFLRDATGALKGRAKTDGEGKFAFPGLPPGDYRVDCIKPTPPTRGDATTKVAAGKTADVVVEMLRTK